MPSLRFAGAKAGVHAHVACILTASTVTAAVRDPYPWAFGLLAMAAAQMSYPLIAYAPEYLQESQSARHADCDPTRANGNTNRKQRFPRR